MRITIIGAGTAGLTSAILLKRKGHHVTVYDKADNPGPVGAGVLLQPSGQEVLFQMGLLEELKKKSQKIHALRGYNTQQETIALLPYENEPGLGVHRGNLFNLLLQTAKNENIKVNFSMKIDQLHTQNSDFYFPQFEQKPSDLIVLANGPNTELLNQTNIKYQSKAYPWGALWAISPSSNHSNELRQLYAETSKFIGLLPAGLHPTQLTPCESFFWSIKLNHLDAWRKQSLTEFKDQVLKYWPACEEAMTDIDSKEQFLVAKYRDAILSRYHDQNLVVLGDSAHAMSPQLGQGVSLALLDSFALSESLGDDLKTSLLHYERSRKQHIQIYQLLTRWLTPLYQSDYNFLATPRDQAIKMGMSIPWVRKKILKTLEGRLNSFL